MINRQCKNCNTTFVVRKANLDHDGYNNRGLFCSTKCRGEFKTKTMVVSLVCVTCGKEFTRKLSHIAGSSTGKNKSDRNFCSQSCSATYNNTHKTYGNRRSKLEAYLESQFRSEFPSLELICNGKEAIGSELDFYFPQIRLAIEINGIFHYEPIYGSDKLERTKANDQQKYANCLAAGIELCIVSCTEKHVTSNVKERYWTIVKNLVSPLLRRMERIELSSGD